jgi:hypothetical protein
MAPRSNNPNVDPTATALLAARLDERVEAMQRSLEELHKKVDAGFSEGRAERTALDERLDEVEADVAKVKFIGTPLVSMLVAMATGIIRDTFFSTAR